MPRNVRSAPAYFTPNLVKRVLEQMAKPHIVTPAPVVAVPVRGDPPVLRVVEPEPSALAAPSVPIVAPAKPSIADGEEKPAAPIAAPPATVDRRRTASLRQNEEGRIAAALAAHARLASWRDAPVTKDAFAIADRRGIAVVDLANALDRNAFTVLAALKRAGYYFGKRPPLAKPLTLDQLIALADPEVPLPELRRDALKRARDEKWPKVKRERRAEARRDDPTYRPKGPRTPKPARQTPVAQVRPAPSMSTPARVAPVMPTARPLPQGRRLSVIEYAERMTWAKGVLAASFCSVRRANPDDPIAKWAVTGQSGFLNDGELVELAERFAARVAG